MRPTRSAAWLALILLTVAARPAPAQAILDPDTCWTCRDTYQHAAAGGLVNIAMHTQIIAPSWRKSFLGRMGLTLAVGATYEVVELVSAWENKTAGQTGYGFGLKDLVADLAGALVVEGVVALGRKLF